VNAWAIVVSGVSGGILAIIAAWGSAFYQQRALGEREAAAARNRAYLELLTRSMTLAQRAQALRLTARLRSGLTESLDVLLRQRRPLDPMQLHDWMMEDMRPAYQAWSDSWIAAPPTVVEAANQLIAACAEVIGDIGYDFPSDRRGRLHAIVAGVQADHDADAAFQRKIEKLGEVRRRFAALIRQETGVALSSALSD
jgi:hypothetical protein